MQVTFRCDGKVAGGYSPGRIYTEELTPYLAAMLKNPTSALILIDPLTLDGPEEAKQPDLGYKPLKVVKLPAPEDDTPVVKVAQPKEEKAEDVKEEDKSE